jgi:hypothetical protein
MFKHYTLLFAFLLCQVHGAEAATLQETINANAGGFVIIDGEYRISEALHLPSGITLRGNGRIVQENPDALVIHIENANDVRIEGITLTRAEGTQDAAAGGIRISGSQNVILDGLRILDCKAREAAVAIQNSTRCTVRDCDIRNYKRIAIDDRTDSPLYGYAFNAIDGLGILVDRSVGTILDSNRIVETALLPTREMKDEHKLGQLTDGKNPTKPGELGEGAVRAGYVNNWHQGSAVVVTGPEDTRHTTITGNQIENAAQGIDLHCDFAVVSGNTIDHCMIGLKMTHGCRGIVMTDNLVNRPDLWGLVLNPGAISHAGGEGKEPNVDAGIIIANNIFADFGYGHEHWNWGNGYAMAFFEGQLEENPPVRDVLISGNLVYDPGRDADGPPRYRYAVYVGAWGEGSVPKANVPQGLRFSDNILHPGTEGVSNGALP